MPLPGSPRLYQVKVRIKGQRAKDKGQRTKGNELRENNLSRQRSKRDQFTTQRPRLREGDGIVPAVHSFDYYHYYYYY